MKVKDITNVLDVNQKILIVADIAAGFMRTIASDVPVTLLAKQVERVYSKNDEIVIETVSRQEERK